MPQKKQLARNSGIYFIINILQRVSNFLVSVLLARTLGPSNFGIFSLAQTVKNFSQKIGMFGLGLNAQKDFSGKVNNEQYKKISQYILINLVFAISIPLLVVLLSSTIANNVFDEPQLEIVLKYFSIIIGVSIVSNFLVSLHRAKRNLRDVFYTQLIEGFFKFIILLVLTTVIELKLLHVIYIYTTVVFFQFIYIVIKSTKLDLFNGIRIRKLPAIAFPNKGMLILGAETTIISMGYFFNHQLDRLMLGFFDNATVVGQYVAIVAIVEVISVVQNSMQNALMPMISESYKNKNYEDIKLSYFFMVKIVTFLNFVFAIFAISFGPLIIKLLYGEQYLNSSISLVLTLLVFIKFVSSWAGPTGATLLMTGNTKYEFMNTSSTIIINIIANTIFIYYMDLDIVGAALATFMAMVVINIIQLFQIKKTLLFKPISKFQISVMALFVLFLITQIYLSITFLVQFILVLFFSLLVTVVEWWFLSISDKTFLRNKILSKLKKGK